MSLLDLKAEASEVSLGLEAFCLRSDTETGTLRHQQYPTGLPGTSRQSAFMGASQPPRAARFKPAQTSQPAAGFPRGGLRAFSVGSLSPLPSCHSVCLTCLLNRSSGCAASPGSPACPPPTALHGGPASLGAGGRGGGPGLGGTGANGWVFYILWGALGL